MMMSLFALAEYWLKVVSVMFFLMTYLGITLWQVF